MVTVTVTIVLSFRSEQYKHLYVSKVEVYAGAIYDAIYLYALALNETLAIGGDQKDGKAMAEKMMDREFEGLCHFFQLFKSKETTRYRHSVVSGLSS